MLRGVCYVLCAVWCGVLRAVLCCGVVWCVAWCVACWIVLCVVWCAQLPWSVTQTELEALFAEYSVDYAHLEIGRKGKSRGWGIVRVTSASKAKRIIGTCKTS